MNNTFSFKRFGYLLREILVERKIFFLGLFVALIAIHLILGYAFGFPYAYADFRAAIALTCFYLGTFALVLAFTKSFDKSAVGLRSFMLPISHLERWLSVLIFITGFLLIFSLLFKLVDSVLITSMKSYINSLDMDDIRETKALEKLTPYTLSSDVSKAVVIFSTLLAVWFLTISSYFKKNKLITAFFVAFAVLFILYVVNWGVNYLFFGIANGLDHNVPFTSSSFEVVNEELGTRNYIRLETGESKTIILSYVTPILTIFLSIIYYFRLKETEI